MKGTPEQRFWAKVQKIDNGCWEWTATKHDVGYGILRICKKNVLAHRFPYELHFGKIPDSTNILHSCDNPSCTNPEHLFVTTHPDNTQDHPQTVEQRFWEKIQKTDTCWLWTRSKTRDGYGLLRVNGVNTSAHRFSYELSYGPIPEGMFVCHHCDNPSCVHPQHLFLGTHTDNMSDMKRKGRESKGESVPTSKLTEKQVLAILQHGADGMTQQQIADIYHIARSHVSLLLNKKSWKHLHTQTA